MEFDFIVQRISNLKYCIMKKSNPQDGNAGHAKAGKRDDAVNGKTGSRAGESDGTAGKLRHSSDPESDVAGHDLRDVDPRKTDFDPTIQYTDGRD